MQSQEEKWLLEEKFNGLESEAFQSDLVLLHSGTPLAYLIGWVPFLDCKIYLSNDLDYIPPIPSSKRHKEFLPRDRTRIKAKQFALIPRPETEFWTEKAITEIRKVRGATPYLDILDLCAGSGAVGVAVAKAIPEVQVDFAEIDPAHLPTIQKNIENNLLQKFPKLLHNRMKGLESDLFENISEDTKYDFILTNPPYIDPVVDRAETSVKMHEPHLALYGGAQGMECIEKIIKQAPLYLNTHGQLWIEHEPEQSKAIAVIAKASDFSCVTHKDQYGIERYSILVLQ